MSESSSDSDSGRFELAAQRFDAVHRRDPKDVEHDGERVPWSVLYHDTVARWVDALDPRAPLTVRLAARAQHIRRWTIPRSDYPEGKTGYKKWRSTLAMMHADEAAAVLDEVGYDEETSARVKDLLIKKRLRSDPEVALLEDAVCLTFLELQYPEFAQQHPPEKVVDILKKTWDKMTKRGHASALKLVGELEAKGAAPRAVELVHRAVSG